MRTDLLKIWPFIIISSVFSFWECLWHLQKSVLRLSYDALHHEKIKGIRCPLDAHFSPTVTPRSGAIGNPMGKYFWRFAVNPKAAFAHCELCQQDWNEVLPLLLLAAAIRLLQQAWVECLGLILEFFLYSQGKKCDIIIIKKKDETHRMSLDSKSSVGIGYAVSCVFKVDIIVVSLSLSLFSSLCGLRKWHDLLRRSIFIIWNIQFSDFFMSRVTRRI